jgi:lactoylglutathione lyase
VGGEQARLLDAIVQLVITGLAHIGIRVHELQRSLAFYRVLGFELVAGPIGHEPVAILTHPCGVEINLVLNAPVAQEPNILMDVPEKHAGITHFALHVPDLEAARAHVEAAGITLSGGPVQFTAHARGFVIRDPDRNVIEIHARV